MGRRILMIGSGGREHALAWRLASSPSVAHLASCPGNPGMAELGPTHPVDITDAAAVATLAERERIDLVVVGPEDPLVAGLVDELSTRGIPAFGPTAAAARLEGSKSFAKDVMIAAGVPTADYVATDDPGVAYEALERFTPPYVVKADGLAAGKGVRICDALSEARDAVDDALVRGRFGHAGSQVVIEEFLHGPERSVFGICDGADAVLLTPAQDYKRALDGDRGLNTGGMGAYAPIPGFGLADVDHLQDLIFRPVLRELAGRGTPFRGLLYAGIVQTVEGPRLLEFNARFGDPETQVIMPLLTSDLADLLDASAQGAVTDVEVTWDTGAAVTVVLASGGYPERFEVDVPIEGLEAASAHDNVEVFHAGIRRHDGGLVTAGGRVCNVTATGPDVESARAAAYAAADRIRFEGRHLRRDIAAEV